MGNYDEVIEVIVDVKKETEKAFLVFDGSTEAWIPKVLIENIDDCVVGKSSYITIPEWIALEKELI